MSAVFWLCGGLIVLHKLGILTAQHEEASDITAKQFAAFVGGRGLSVQVGVSFQTVRNSGLPVPNVGRFTAVRAGVKGICENPVHRCDPASPYRTEDGSCNNLDNPTWGKAITPMRRFLPPVYGDGISTPRTKGKYGMDLPSARFISTTVHGIEDIGQIPKYPDISHMVMQWGHFLDHDITHSPVVTRENMKPIDCCKEGNDKFPCFPIRIPPNDPFFKDKTCLNFVRSIQVPNANCTFEPVEQMNAITSFVDASNVYGSGEKGNLRLRVDGLLNFSDFNLLPTNGDSADVCDAPCFDAGDVRRNEQMGLTSMHTLFMREHNRIARSLKTYNPHWTDEKLFQESRKIVGAVTQKITYSDWLSIVLDPKTRKDNGIDNSKSGYDNVYDATVNPSIRNVFGAAAFRFGHSLVRSAFSRRNYDYTITSVQNTSDMFGTTSLIRQSFGRAVDQFLRGLLVDRAGILDRFITPELTNKLFKSANNSLDLAALNIQRGRDHGIPPYNTWREWCGLPKAVVFLSGPGGFTDHSPEVVHKLSQAYHGLSPDDVDLFPAAISERPSQYGGILGPTFACILGQQFGALKKGDRFWYELPRPHTGFTTGQLREIQKSSLARIICDNTSTFFLQPNVFFRRSKRNPLQSCSRIPRMDLRKWQEHSYQYPW